MLFPTIAIWPELLFRAPNVISPVFLSVMSNRSLADRLQMIQSVEAKNVQETRLMA